MRIRTIKPEFWEHPVMGRKSDATKLLAIGLLNVADDEGYFYADAKLIRNAIRPFDDESGITTVSIRELSEIGYISIRKHPTHGDIGKVVSFLEHQVINKPKRSKLKELHEYGIDTVLIPDEERLERKGKEGNREGKGAPPNPQGGFPFVQEILPQGWNRLTKTEQGRVKVTRNTPEMIRIGKWFGQREATLWTVSEYIALTQVDPSPEDMDLIGEHYSYEIPENGYRMTTISTLLNNWSKARAKAVRYFEENPELRSA